MEPEPVSGHYPSQMNLVNTLKPHFFKIHFNITLLLHLGLQVASSLQVFRPKFCMHLSSLPCVSHAQAVSWHST